MICLGPHERTQMVDRLIVRELHQVKRMQRGMSAVCWSGRQVAFASLGSVGQYPTPMPAVAQCNAGVQGPAGELAA